MPPTNDSGVPLTVGPDVNGQFFDVTPGEEYELPEPPRTVLDEEKEAQPEAEAPSAPSGDLGSTPSQPPAPTPKKQEPAPPQNPPAGDVPPASTEGAQA